MGARASVVLAALVTVVACRQEMPTGIGGDQAEPVTIEIELPWSEFATNLAVFGGYGVASELGRGVVANQYAGTLDAHTLVRFGGFPTQTLVLDSTGTNRVDSLLTIVSGRLVARFDTIASTNAGPVDLAVGALQNEWQARTVSWTNALDTINDQRAWPEPGGGPVLPLGTATWDPSTGDSVSFVLDSAGVSLWTDTLDLTRGARLELTTGGERLQVTTAQLRVTFRPSIDPDTLIELPLLTQEITFIYDPFPQPPPDGIRIGGTPSWRTVLDMEVPPQLAGPTGFCAVVSCPHTVEPGQISYAALVLTSRASDAAFQPTDSVGLDVRTVLLRSALPKAPLGPSLVADLLNGRRVRAEAFGSNPGERVEIPITGFARALLADSTGTEVPNTLALLSVFEPLSIAFASFHGPGTPDEPRLRLVLTIGPPVELP
jgi:hypothetical protein